MVSRFIVIILAFAAALYRLSHGAFVEAAGLAGLGGGLLCLRLAVKRPSLRYAAYMGFLLTGISILVVIIRDYL